MLMKLRNYEICKIKANTEGGFTRLFALFETETLSVLSVDPVFKTPTRSGQHTLHIFHISGLHHRLVDDCNVECSFSAPARIGAMVRKNRDSGVPTLFFSAGDDHIGTPMDILTGEREEEFIMSPVFRVFTRLGLDATVLGNHDFDLPPAVLRRAAGKDAGFPVLFSNIKIKGLPTPSALLGLAGGLRVGVMGINTLDELHLTEDPLRGIFLEHPEKPVKRLIPLRKSNRCL
ncbi:MAG: hypothetical protein DRP87_19935 [Spirochaetes bacterium]|nr:MAG: hypothetical protein DRP87_19935 [Spirochaetota bacterium]